MLETVALAFAALREAMLLAAFGIALSGLDDLFIDAVFLVRRTVRMVAVRPFHRRVTVEELGSDDPGWFAILVPAWDEAAVIGTMLRGLIGTYLYPRFRVSACSSGAIPMIPRRWPKLLPSAIPASNV